MTTQRTVKILGNGQLGLMLGKAAKKLEIPLAALSLSEAWDWLPEADPDRDLITFEQEHVDEALLKALEQKGTPAFPTWKSFETLKSKRSQKQFLMRSGIPSSPFVTASPWREETESFLSEHNGAVLKAGRGGYDGKGVWRISSSGKSQIGRAHV